MEGAILQDQLRSHWTLPGGQTRLAIKGKRALQGSAEVAVILADSQTVLAMHGERSAGGLAEVAGVLARCQEVMQPVEQRVVDARQLQAATRLLELQAMQCMRCHNVP